MSGDGTRSASYLSPPEIHRLDIAVRPIKQALGTPFLVGSVLQRRDYRDVDVRVLLDDADYDLIPDPLIRLIGYLGSEYLRGATGLPVDFQIQRRTDANEQHDGIRNPLGGRKLPEFRGDAAPPSPTNFADRDAD